MYNILEHKTEKERIIFEDSDPTNGFILLPGNSKKYKLDTKFQLVKNQSSILQRYEVELQN